ncbi:hypothetical protein ACS0TY_025227 [Phlomoides rotata]
MRETKEENKHSENGEDEKKQDVRGKKQQLGGVRTMPFILGETTSSYANCSSSLRCVLNMPIVKASNTITIFSGTSSFTPLIGAFIADSYVGRFWTIIFGNFIYLLLGILYLALLLTSLGTGGIRPCVVTFAADQFDMSKAKTESRTWNFFNWFYFTKEMAALLALTLIVYIQDNASWSWGLGIPTIIMGMSLVAFILGSRMYKKHMPAGSPYVRVAQVIVAAVKKRRALAPTDSHALYQNTQLDAPISTNGSLLHTHQFRWFDQW